MFWLVETCKESRERRLWLAHKIAKISHDSIGRALEREQWLITIWCLRAGRKVTDQYVAWRGVWSTVSCLRTRYRTKTFRVRTIETDRTLPRYLCDECCFITWHSEGKAGRSHDYREKDPELNSTVFRLISFSVNSNRKTLWSSRAGTTDLKNNCDGKIWKKFENFSKNNSSQSTHLTEMNFSKSQKFKLCNVCDSILCPQNMFDSFCWLKFSHSCNNSTSQF